MDSSRTLGLTGRARGGVPRGGGGGGGRRGAKRSRPPAYTERNFCAIGNGSRPLGVNIPGQLYWTDSRPIAPAGPGGAALPRVSDKKSLSGKPRRQSAGVAFARPRTSCSRTAAIALVFAATLSLSAAAVTVGAELGTAGAASSRLCSPADDSRAYVTTIASDDDDPAGQYNHNDGDVSLPRATINSIAGGDGSEGQGGGVMEARVLAQSLRSAGAKGDVVVLVPLERATEANLQALRRDGLKVQVVPRAPQQQSGGGETVSEDLMTKVFLWSLTSYSRVVYLDPRSRVQKNPDALFACEGFCAAGAIPSPSPAFQGGGGVAEALSTDDDEDEAAGVVLEAPPLPLRPTWQPSTSVMVLEPSGKVHETMLGELARRALLPPLSSSESRSSLARARSLPSSPEEGEVVGSLSPPALDAQAFLSSFLDAAGDRCTPFEDLVESASGRWSGPGAGSGKKSGRGGGVRGGSDDGGGGWGDAFGGDGASDGSAIGGGRGGGGGGHLEDALMPVVLLNGPHMPRCAVGRERTPAHVCQRLPPAFAAPLTDYHEWGDWGRAQKRCALCEQGMEPHIIHFADQDASWKRAAYEQKSPFWKWGKNREQREYPFGNFFAPWVLFFIPCVVLAFARVYYKIAGAGDLQGKAAVGPRAAAAAAVAAAADGAAALAGTGEGTGTGNITGTSLAACPEHFPSKKGRLIPWFLGPKKHQLQQQQQRQMAILPSCAIAAAYDGGSSSVGASLEAAGTATYGSGSPGVIVAAGPELLGSGNAGGGGGLRTGACYALSAVVWVLGLAWFRATRSLALEIVDERWPPAIAAAVYNAWLCCALVLGLYVMDYLYYAFLTRGKTLAKDTAAVALFAFGVALLRSSATVGGGGVAWEGAVGVGVIALGVGHGSRAGAAHHLSGRGHFRCITASCVAGALVSLALCYDGARTTAQDGGLSGGGGGGRAAAAVAAAQMCFTALVYASVIGGTRLRADMDEAGSKLGRSCSTASFASEIAASPGASPERRASIAGGALAEAALPPGWGAVLSAVARAAGRAKDAVWRRRWVTACVAILVLWKVSASLRPTTPGRRFEKYGLSCLGNDEGEFVEAGVKRMSRVCGAEQALKPVATGAYFEAFRQDKVCLEVAGGGFLSLDRIHVFQTCAPENQFVFQHVPSKKTRAGSKGDSAPSNSAADDGEYCVYNPTSGFYLSAQPRPKAQCGEKERWRVSSVPRSARPKKGAGGIVSTTQQQQRQSTASVLVHPSFLSRGPLHTFYGYLLAATVLLVARAVFAKLAGWQSAAASSSGGGSGGGISAGDGGSGGSSSKHRQGGIGARQRSRGRSHSRSRNTADTGCFGDPGYAGDAETGGVGYSSGGGSGCAAGGRVRPSPLQFGFAPSARDLSESPVPGVPLDRMGWNMDIMFGVNGAGEQGDLAPPVARSASASAVATAWPKGFGSAHLSRDRDTAPAARAARGHERLVKLFSWLCMLCDATLLAGLWCLVPAHFAQAMSALTRDHHSAIDRGLGMDPNNPGNGPWSRSLGEGVVAGSGGSGGETLSVVGLIGVGGGVGAADRGVSALSCDSGAWWLTSALVRLHLVFLLVAFCHLHGAVKAAGSSSGVRGRNRRTGKKTTERASLWGLRSGERLALRLRTALGVLAMLCAAVTAAGAELGERSGLLFLGLHAHPAWSKCAASAGLDESWGPVSPLLVFAMLSAAASVYVRAGATGAVRVGAGVGLLAALATVSIATGRAYLALAAAAAAMDWAAWGVAGLLSCVCYQSPAAAMLERESSGSAASVEDDFGGGGGAGGAGGGCQHRGGASSGGITATAGARHRSNDARRLTCGRALGR